MQPWELGMSIPIIGFVCAACIFIARMAFQHDERKHQMMFQGKDAGNEALRSEVETLRTEIARLRDTSTQYDISIQHTLEDMQHRLAFLENKRPMFTPVAPAVEEPTQQSVGLGNQ